MTSSAFTRRNGLRAMVALAATGAAMGADMGASRPVLAKSKDKTPKGDLADPQESLHAFVRLNGSLKGGPVYRWHTGVISAIMPGEPPLALVGYDGLEKEVYTANDDGSFTSAYFDIGYFKDLKTGERLTTWANPVTGATVDVIPFRSGRFAATLKPGEPLHLWNQRGDEVFVSQTSTTAFPNMMTPEAYPAESSGTKFFFSVVRVMRGRQNEVVDAKRDSVPLLWSYSLSTIWLPWMKMGQRPGSVQWSGHGGKYTGPAQIPREFRAFLAAEQPDYLTAKDPWMDMPSRWASYMRSHPPKAALPAAVK